MAEGNPFADRLLAETYAQDEGVQLDYAGSEMAIIPERLFGRAQCVARGYDLHVLPAIDIHTKTRLHRSQCETLLDEIAFIAMVSSDELLREKLVEMRTLVAQFLGSPQRELFVEGP